MLLNLKVPVMITSNKKYYEFHREYGYNNISPQSFESFKKEDSTLQIRISKELKAKAEKKIAEQHKMSISRFIREILKEFDD